MSNDDTSCPCDAFIHPRSMHNAPGLDEITYRVGEYATFREALLRALPNEQALAKWKPTAKGDLGLQMLEWWAYLADILTFYNERIANDSYLRAAYSPESVKRLVNLLGYRPRPALASSGLLAALTTGNLPITVTRGLPLQNKPPPGSKLQLFEVDANSIANAPGSLDVVPIVDSYVAGGRSVWLSGVVSSILAGDELLLVPQNWTPETSQFAWRTVESVSQEKDASGNTNTKVAFKTDLPTWPNVKVKECRLYRSYRETRLYVKPNAAPILVFLEGIAHLATIVRDLSVGQLVLFTSMERTHFARVTAYREVVWYENAPIGVLKYPWDPPDPPTIPLPNLHTEIDYLPKVGGVDYDHNPLSGYRVLYGFGSVGTLIDEPIHNTSSAKLTLLARSAIPAFLKVGKQVIVEDAKGKGALATIESINGKELVVKRADTTIALELPLRVLYNLIHVSRGKTVPREVLGDGDATQIGQTFTLAQSPLTYFAGALPGSTLPYHNTLRVVVNDIAWTEVESFYGQAPDAQIFITRQDDEGKTQVIFGDGIHGARLPGGEANVIASYRYGGGAEAPEATTLTVLTKPLPGMSTVRNPVAIGGGADAETPDMTRRTGPRSVLTFGRAISGDDYEAIALAAGVPRAKSYYSWDADMQRAVVKLYVGGSSGAVDLAISALKPAIDPNRPLLVLPAVERVCKITLAIVRDARYEVEPLRAALQEVLRGETVGIFDGGLAHIGVAMYNSWILEACMRVPGVVGVSFLQFVSTPAHVSDTNVRHEAGEGGFFSLNENDLAIIFDGAGASP